MVYSSSRSILRVRRACCLRACDSQGVSIRIDALSSCLLDDARKRRFSPYVKLALRPWLVSTANDFPVSISYHDTLYQTAPSVVPMSQLISILYCPQKKSQNCKYWYKLISILHCYFNNEKSKNVFFFTRKRRFC